MDKQPDEVSGMFDDVAKHYDRTNAVMSVGNAALWRLATVKAVDPQPGERILDVAAGRQRHPRIEFVEANAEKLPFGDDEFDAVTISFGLRNVEHPKAALAEMYRVLKPGGRLVVCEFSKPPRALFRTGYQVYTRFVMPLVAKVVSSDSEAYDYLAESIRNWPDQGTLSQWIRGVGFTRVAYRNLTAGVVALHRGRKPEDPAIRASTAKRKAPRAPRTPVAP